MKPFWKSRFIYIIKFAMLFVFAVSAAPAEKEISRVDEDHYVEIFGSPAIADGRIYFTTEERLYCIGGSK